MILTLEIIRQFKSHWDSDRNRRYLRGNGIQTFEDYLITLAHKPDRCPNCNMLDSMRCGGFTPWRGNKIHYSCTWCYDDVYVLPPGAEGYPG